MRWFLLLPFAALSAQAQGLPNCAIEPSASAQATCLNLEADLRIGRMETRIEKLIGGIQGAPSQAQSRFEDAIKEDQQLWKERTSVLCEQNETRLDRTLCLREEIAKREARLDDALEPLEAQAYDLPYTTDGVRIFVPLDGGKPRPFLTLDDILTPR